MKNKHLLGIDDLNLSEIYEILNLAEDYVKINRGVPKKLTALKKFTQINVFFENSTRTLSSFELAGKKLGASSKHQYCKKFNVKR